MKVRQSKRMESFQTSIFSELAEYKKKKLKEGATLIDLSIGSPDLAPPSFIKDTLASEVLHDDQYGYSITGSSEFNKTVASFYDQNYDVKIEADDEVLQLMGSQDGLVHFPMVFANSGDLVLVPDPGYTAYAVGIEMAGATPYFMPLKKENHFLPDLSAIPEAIASQAKMMFLNFPGNPVPALANKEFFAEVVAFAKKYEIIVLHDFAYSELYYEGNKPISFLSVEGAMEVGVEMSSFSKNYNMAGSRIGFLAGNKEIIKAMHQLKSNLDYGVFYPIQKAAIKALKQGSSFCEINRKIYEARRDVLVDGLNAIGWRIDKPDAGMFVWAQVPNGYSSSEFTYTLIEKANVVVVPGNAFGPTGEGYVRIALVEDKDRLKEVVKSIKTSGVLKKGNESEITD